VAALRASPARANRKAVDQLKRATPLLKQRCDGLDGEEQATWPLMKRYKAKVPVEGVGRLVFGVA